MTGALVLLLCGLLSSFSIDADSSSGDDQDSDGILDVDEGFDAEVVNNGGFELQMVSDFEFLEASDVDYWSTSAVNDTIEVWADGFRGVPAFEGDQFAELNSDQIASLFQDFQIPAGVRVRWTVAHRGRDGVDVASVSIGSADAETLAVQETMSSDNTTWTEYSGVYIVPEGQGTTRFSFDAITSAGSDSAGNFIDGFTLVWEGRDSDGDGQDDHLDLDSDDDSIPDALEGIADVDNDSMPNYLDTDSDGDGILDDLEAGEDPSNPLDSDNDTIPDYREFDSDNDGILDSLEAGEDPSNPLDSDNDTIPDYREIDSDNDGILDSLEAGDDLSNPLDSDSDTIPDYREIDSDNDSILDALEVGEDTANPLDTDNDTTPDFRDIDSDDDGLLDGLEVGSDPANPLDTDSDTIPDYRDDDSDEDGIFDALEAGDDPAQPTDTDNDGTPDFRETDSDNDGLSDTQEAGDDPLNPQDSNGNGIPDFREDNSDSGAEMPTDSDSDSDGDGLLDIIEGTVDTDEDGVIDSLDLDSDNDGISDALEAGIDPDRPLEPLDTDGDGIIDALDRDSDNDGLSDTLESRGQTSDVDGDGIIDNFIDSDGDGQHDEPTLQAIDTDNDGVPNHLSLDSDGDGSPDTIESAQPNVVDVFGNTLDADQDGIADAMVDSDSDGIPDSVDIDFVGIADSDGDGIVDTADVDQAGGSDSDGDGIIDSSDADADGDGFVDLFSDAGGPAEPSTLPDTNGNSVPDVLEPNSPGSTRSGVIRSGLQGGGCSINGVSSSEALWILLIGAGAMVWLRRRSIHMKPLIFSCRGLPMKSRLLPLVIASLLSTGTYGNEIVDASSDEATSIGVAPASTAKDRRMYMGFGLGRSWLEPDTSEVDGIDVTDRVQLGGQFTFGKDIGPRFSLEGHFAELGSAGLTQGAEVAYREFGLSGLAYLGRSHARLNREGLFAFGRAGVGFLLNESSGDITVEQDNSFHLLIGAGLEYATRPGLALRAEILLIDADVNYSQLGLVYRFGGVKRTIDAAIDATEDTIADTPEETVLPLESPPSTSETVTKIADSDDDGVIDSQDACQDTPSAIAVDASGCAVFSGTMEGVKFEVASARLTSDAERILDDIIESLQPYPTLKLEISAHTDNQGNDKANEQLSIARARAVAAYFIRSGIAIDRITARAFGESSPIAPNNTAEGRRENRRVELRVLNDS